MISLRRLREIEPKLKHSSDEEVAVIREQLYQLAQLAYENYEDSKITVGLIAIDDEK